jgi:hypothetical protein
MKRATVQVAPGPCPLLEGRTDIQELSRDVLLVKQTSPAGEPVACENHSYSSVGRPSGAASS